MNYNDTRAEVDELMALYLDNLNAEVVEFLIRELAHRYGFQVAIHGDFEINAAAGRDLSADELEAVKSSFVWNNLPSIAEVDVWNALCREVNRIVNPA